MIINRLLLNVGAMKSGTTWLFRQLEQHPGIHFSPEKEIHYLAFAAGHRGHMDLSYRWSRFQAALRRANGASRSMGWSEWNWYLDYLLMPRTWNWYTRRFRGVAPGQYCADFSNLSALLPVEYWRELRDRVGELRLLYVMRNPLERLWSHLKFHYQHGGQQNLLEGLQQPVGLSEGTEDQFLEHSLYAKHLSRILEVVPRENVHLVYFDDIASQPDRVLQGIEEFLGLPHHAYLPGKLTRRINPSIDAKQPDWVQQTYAPAIRRDQAALHDLNVRVPEAWSV